MKIVRFVRNQVKYQFTMVYQSDDKSATRELEYPMNEPLSEREIEILRLVADGLANGEIAARLSLALNTIKWYNKRIYEKLGVENRTQAIKRAQALGLLEGSNHQAKPMPPQHNLPSPLTTFVGRRAELIDLAYDLGFSNGVAVALIGVAGALARLGHPHQAAQFLGAADAIQDALGMGITAADEPDYQRTHTELQAQLGKADFERCWQAGRTLTVKAATILIREFSSAQPLLA